MAESAGRTWDEVLAAVEADVQRAGELLLARAESVVADPLSWLPADRVLPALAEMPPVPAELCERIVSLRDRIRELQAELSDALAGRTPPLTPTFELSVAASSGVARYVDRRV